MTALQAEPPAWLSAEAVITLKVEQYATPPHYDEPRQLLSLPPSWTADAACGGQDDRVFYGTEERPALTVSQIAWTRRLCSGCGVRLNCLAYSLDQRERHGMWAGTTARQRERILTLIDRGIVTLHQVVRDFARGKHQIYEQLWSVHADEQALRDYFAEHHKDNPR